MSSETVNGCIIDKGAYTFPGFYKDMRKFLAELDFDQHLVKTPGTSSTFSQGKEYKVKIGSPTDFMKYKLLSFKNKLDIMKIFVYSQSLGKALDLFNPTPKTFELEQETATEYLLKHYDEEILERIAYPTFCEIFLGNPEGNSKLAFLATLDNLTMFTIYAFAGGMGILPEYLAKTLDVRFDTPVRRIQKNGRHRTYEVFTGKGGDKPFTCDAVILALPLPAAADMLNDLPDKIKESLRAIEYTPSIVTAWGLEKPFSGRSLTNNFLRKDFQIVGTLVSDEVKAAPRVPSGKGLVTVILNEAASRDLFDASDDKIYQAVLREVDAVFPSFSEQVIFNKIYRWEHSVVQLPPRALANKQKLRKTLEQEFDRIYVASDSLYRTTMETSFKTGIMAAEKLMEEIAR